MHLEEKLRVRRTYILLSRRKSETSRIQDLNPRYNALPRRHIFAAIKADSIECKQLLEFNN